MKKRVADVPCYFLIKYVQLSSSNRKCHLRASGYSSSSSSWLWLLSKMLRRRLSNAALGHTLIKILWVKGSVLTEVYHSLFCNTKDKLKNALALNVRVKKATVKTQKMLSIAYFLKQVNRFSILLLLPSLCFFCCYITPKNAWCCLCDACMCACVYVCAYMCVMCSGLWWAERRQLDDKKHIGAQHLPASLLNEWLHKPIACGVPLIVTAKIHQTITRK